MNFCIVGTGAVGAIIAVQLTRAGHQVSVVARGPHYDAIGENGLSLVSDAGENTVRVQVSRQGEGLTKPDAIIVAVKAISLASTAPIVANVAAEDTPIAFALNGLPWWYPYSRKVKERIEKGGHRMPMLDFLDPDNVLAEQVGGMHRTIGCVVYAAGRMLRPGVVQSFQVDHRKVIFGEITGAVSERVSAIAEAFNGTELEGSAVPDIDKAVWRKLVTNVAQSPICCLTGQPMNVLGRSRDLLQMAQSLMREVSATAAAWGTDVGIDPETHFGERSLNSPHKPSMLQDLEAGRQTEIDALLRAVQECARSARVETPTLDSLTALLTERLPPAN